MTRTFRLNKLVRDGIVPEMIATGQKPSHYVLSSEEMKSALNAKLIEEAQEGDLADLLEVIEAKANTEGKTFDDIRLEQLAKREKMGGFAIGVYVGDLTLNDGDKWIEYYASHSDRFPEISSP